MLLWVPLPCPPPPPSPDRTRQGLKGGSSLRASRSSQLMWRKKGCFWGGGEWDGVRVEGVHLAPTPLPTQPCQYLHIGRVAWAPPDPLAGVSLEELEGKRRGGAGRRGGTLGRTYPNTAWGGGSCFHRAYRNKGGAPPVLVGPI